MKYQNCTNPPSNRSRNIASNIPTSIVLNDKQYWQDPMHENEKQRWRDVRSQDGSWCHYYNNDIGLAKTFYLPCPLHNPHPLQNIRRPWTNQQQESFVAFCAAVYSFQKWSWRDKITVSCDWNETECEPSASEQIHNLKTNTNKYSLLISSSERQSFCHHRWTF